MLLGKVLLVLIALVPGFNSTTRRSLNDDLLLPYDLHRRHGPQKHHRVVRDLAIHDDNNNMTFATYAAQHTNNSNNLFGEDVVSVRYFVSDVPISFPHRYAAGHLAVVSNPAKTLSVLEPSHKGGCANNTLSQVTQTVQQSECFVAVNAGFFNTSTGACLGNVVSDGVLVENSGGIQNAHFGIRQDGSIEIGYFSEDHVLNDSNPFTQLVGGVVWLVREGKSFVEHSLQVEDDSTEETGTLKQFIDVVSARTAIGHDKDGRVVIVNVDGQTNARGVNLFEFADLLISFGVVNAINLDGGGSSTFVVNGTVANYPSDHCEDDNTFRCPRDVTTAICVHPPRCPDPGCGLHGACVGGACVCADNYSGEDCGVLRCSEDCSGHGECKETGCVCEEGWVGEACNRSCDDGFYGDQCLMKCACVNSDYCDPVSGECQCLPGWTGALCDQPCVYGYYGDQCEYRCNCTVQCYCHHITGSCNVTTTDDLYYVQLIEAGHCQAANMIHDANLVPYSTSLSRQLFIAEILTASVAIGSLLVNIAICWRKCSCCNSYRRQTSNKIKYRALLNHDIPISPSDFEMDHIQYRMELIDAHT